MRRCPRHTLESARDALSFVAGRERSDLDQDRQLVPALVKSVEIIGEAAAGISGKGRTEATDMPWRRIIAMRNFLVHVSVGDGTCRRSGSRKVTTR